MLNSGISGWGSQGDVTWGNFFGLKIGLKTNEKDKHTLETLYKFLAKS